MRGKVLVILALVCGLAGWATLATPASAHPPDGGYSSYYYGLGRHDFRPHGHTYNTPFGSYSYYGRGLHDVIPHGHYYYTPSYTYPNYYAPSPSYYGNYGNPRYYNGAEYYYRR